ncbi:hypothetical protein [Levilactobacillus brevis]|uniref:hypothetical protein n=1 Tax=Levilactobacillus brevis TaxID=1580 RepID=UPI0015DEE155|nr:hypothetical protein [Levilactobacillus brevis]
MLLDPSKVQERTQKRIDILRLLDFQGEEPMTFSVPHEAKESIRSELKTMGITESFIYPDPSHIANEIAGDY